MVRDLFEIGIKKEPSVSGGLQLEPLNYQLKKLLLVVVHFFVFNIRHIVAIGS